MLQCIQHTLYTCMSQVIYTASLEPAHVMFVRSLTRVHHTPENDGKPHTRDAHLWGTGTAVSLEHCDSLHHSAGRGPSDTCSHVGWGCSIKYALMTAAFLSSLPWNWDSISFSVDSGTSMCSPNSLHFSSGSESRANVRLYGVRLGSVVMGWTY